VLLRRFVSIALLVALVVVALLPGLPALAKTQAAPFNFGLELVAEGFDRPVQVVDAGDSSGRLFVVEQGGRIRIVADGEILGRPFLDVSRLVSCCGERGLLSVAFDQDYARTGILYVDYTDVNGDTVIARYRVRSEDDNQVDPTSAQTILSVEQPASNHNGGLLLFGPQDGYLYIGLGDGGGGNGQNGQDLSTLLGKILRIDVTPTTGDVRYQIPPHTPFVGRAGARLEIWATGLRNPWRFSFDRETGDLWIGDVGAGSYEEVNFQSAGSQGGENYGWNEMEGYDCRIEGGCDAFVAPVSGFDHDEGCVVTGGYVYRGSAIPALTGTYLFADYCGGDVWGLVPNDDGTWTRLGPVDTDLSISSFGEDASGELYLVDLNGDLYRIVAP
jgi:glucose/arabinose dehydrogenase